MNQSTAALIRPVPHPISTPFVQNALARAVKQEPSQITTTAVSVKEEPNQEEAFSTEAKLL